jgi:IS30 family transposase
LEGSQEGCDETYRRVCVLSVEHVRTDTPNRFLHPLPILEHKWKIISMDFIIGLAKAQGKDCIFLVVERLTKFVHFFVIPIDYSVVQVVELFFTYIFIPHRFPWSIVSDRGRQIIITFWQDLFKLVGIESTSSTSYHPWTNGKIEIVNNLIKGYMRNYVSG